jgi:hypothetical protein
LKTLSAVRRSLLVGAILMAMTMAFGVSPAVADDIPAPAYIDSSGASAVSPTGFSVDVVCELAGVVTSNGITATVVLAGAAPGAVAINAECVLVNTYDRVRAAFPGPVVAGAGVFTMPFEQPRLCAVAEAWFVDGSRAYGSSC